MKIRFIKSIDASVGRMITSVLPTPKRRPVPAPQRCLFIRPGGIGDAVLLLPALNAFKSAYPSCIIDVLAEKRNAAAFGLTSCIRAVHRYDSLSDFAGVLRTSYDVVIDTEQWYRLSAVMARLTGAPMIVGFASNKRKRLFTHSVSYLVDQYEAYSFFQLLGPLRVEVPARIAIPFLEPPPAAFEAAVKLLAPLSGRPFVSIFPGASTPQKQWGADRFRELTALLLSRGVSVVLVGGDDSRRDALEIAMGTQALNLVGRSSLAVSAALIKKGRALVSGDSGLLHIAAGLGTPTVSLFGPSDVRKWGPQGEANVVLAAGLPCAPCSRFGTTPSCPSALHCLKEIAVKEVAQACEALLATEVRS